jgi:excisionase family DNA binding protein
VTTPSVHSLRERTAEIAGEPRAVPATNLSQILAQHAVRTAFVGAVAEPHIGLRTEPGSVPIGGLRATHDEGEPSMNERQRAEKLLLTVTEAAALLGIGRTLMYELIRTGAVCSVTVGRLRRLRRADLETYAAGLAAQSADLLTVAA